MALNQVTIFQNIKDTNAPFYRDVHQILERISEIYGNNMDYYLSLKGTKYFKLVDTEMNQALYILQATSNVVKQSNQADLSAKLEKRFNDVAQRSGF
jgi:hypothetical protein